MGSAPSIIGALREKGMAQAPLLAISQRLTNGANSAAAVMGAILAE
jgi:hypothetical protein